MKRLLTYSEIQDFKDDGVVVLRGVFNEWIDTLSKGADFHIKNPSEGALVHEGNEENVGPFWVHILKM